ncbi:MAG: nuclear transport factor 2 family protein [Saprospiraceae bacterium]|nr:nuclear transport factor 2 family protein [Saprospiraceae bacterium]MBK7788538.1 nuclear transport factor 2 family protein [Saprospiraceae bacterium]MBK8851758.1 nuclear transport factor 2 family protein [Saprospiraceae bacterium]
MKRQILTIFTILTFLSCRQSESLTENETESIIKDVQLTLVNYYTDIRKSGLTAEFKYLDNSSDFFWVPPGYSGFISYDSVATVLKQNAPKYISIDNSFDTLRIIPLSKELATYTGRLNSTMTDTSGKIMTFSLVETGVLIKRQDGWKLLSGQTSILQK